MGLHGGVVSYAYGIAAWTLLALLHVPGTRAQSVNVPIPVFGDNTKHKWYVWLIVSLVGIFLIYTGFFVVRGCLVARRRRRALAAAGLSEDDPVYGEEHKKVLQNLIPKEKRPQGKSFAPMSDALVAPKSEKEEMV